MSNCAGIQNSMFGKWFTPIPKDQSAKLEEKKDCEQQVSNIDTVKSKSFQEIKQPLNPSHEPDPDGVKSFTSSRIIPADPYVKIVCPKLMPKRFVQTSYWKLEVCKIKIRADLANSKGSSS